MKKLILVVIALFLPVLVYSQKDVKKWASSAYMDLISNNKNSYTYYVFK